MQRETHQNCKSILLDIISKSLKKMRRLLSCAQLYKPNKYSIMTISNQIAFSLKALHDIIINELHEASTNSALTTVQVVKCLTVLIGYTPYEKLQIDLVKQVLITLLKTVEHKNINVKVAALGGLNSFLALEGNSIELQKLFKQYFLEKDITIEEIISSFCLSKLSLSGHLFSQINFDSPWLERMCIYFIFGLNDDRTFPIAFRIESLKLFCSYSKTFRDYYSKKKFLIELIISDLKVSNYHHLIKLSDDLKILL
ncbi:MAG: HEAT repeat-containing protein 6 [Paramarteilia canceri]